VKDIPVEAVQPCYDPEGKIAEKGAKWNPTDVLNGRPRSRLVTACKATKNDWQLTCELGGRAHYFKVIKIHREDGSWLPPEVTEVIQDPKIDCNALK